MSRHEPDEAEAGLTAAGCVGIAYTRRVLLLVVVVVVVVVVDEPVRRLLLTCSC